VGGRSNYRHAVVDSRAAAIEKDQAEASLPSSLEAVFDRSSSIVRKVIGGSVFPFHQGLQRSQPVKTGTGEGRIVPVGKESGITARKRREW